MASEQLPPVDPADIPAPAYAVESAFLTPPTDTALEDQRDRLRVLMDRGALVLLLVAAITLLAALTNTLRGNFSVVYWAIPFAVVGLAAALYYGSQRFGQRPGDAVEVPASLAPLLNDVAVVRGEIISVGGRVLDPEERVAAISKIDEQQRAAFASAQQALELLRAGDQAGAQVQIDLVNQQVAEAQRARDEAFAEWGDDEVGYEAAPADRFGDQQQSQSTRPSWSAPAVTQPVQPVQPGARATAPSEAGQPTSLTNDPTRHFWSARPASRESNVEQTGDQPLG